MKFKPPPKQEAKQRIEKLVNLFNENANNPQVDETITRRQFIDGLFSNFGWDIQNQELRPLNEKYVYEEERVSIGSGKKRPDYTFTNGANKKLFYVEAKSPKVKIQTGVNAAFQVRRYGWSEKLYISILTNFEEFSIYNTLNIEPHHLDPAFRGRVDYLKYTDYIDKFDYLWNIFAFENVMNGSITDYARRKGIIAAVPIKGSISVDEAFLRDIEGWRTLLAKNIVLRNQDITKPELNYAVQKIIDRIIFLRIIEDRDIESLGSMKDFATDYTSLCKMFHNADKKYNSGLFHHTEEENRGIPDTITQKLRIDDKTIQDIIYPLYDGCKYAFDVIPAYILGSVYERFLGKEVIVEKKNAKVEDKPEVRKAGGVYYTPEYIVEYIIKNTIDKKIITATNRAGASSVPTNENIVAATLAVDRNKKTATQNDISNQNNKTQNPFSILDPACGSGSFLLVAYQYMLDYYQRKKPKEKLTLQERKQILLEYIYGVDLDEQAVEVTKLSLHLKLLEGVDEYEINEIGKQEIKALPSLHNNIKCGNSLIDDHTVAGEKAFVWEKEFPNVFNAGGFDVVIGNPPYVQLQKDKANSKNYAHYETYTATGDIYCIFYEKAMKLLKQNGSLGFITSNKWMRAGYGEKLRSFFAKYNPVKLLDFSGIKIFEDATVDCNILIIQKKENRNNTMACNMKKDFEEINLFVKNNFNVCTFNTSAAWVIMNNIEQQIKNKIEKHGKPLKQWDINIYRGVLTGFNEAFIIDKHKRAELINNDPKSNEIIKPILRRRDIKRYSYKFADLYLIATFPALKLNIDDYPAVKEHLLSFGKDRLKQTGEKGSRRKADNEWFETADKIAYYKEFYNDKIIFPDIVQEPKFYLDNKGEFIPNDTNYFITGENYLEFLCCALHTKLITFVFKTFYAGGGLGETGYRYKKQFLELLPIPIPDSKTESKIEKLLAKKDYDGIDEIVYKLYDLNEEEIGYIKNSK